MFINHTSKMPVSKIVQFLQKEACMNHILKLVAFTIVIINSSTALLGGEQKEKKPLISVPLQEVSVLPSSESSSLKAKEDPISLSLANESGSCRKILNNQKFLCCFGCATCITVVGLLVTYATLLGIRVSSCNCTMPHPF